MMLLSSHDTPTCCRLVEASGDSQCLYLYESAVVGNTADWGAGVDTGMTTFVVSTVVAQSQGTYGGGGGIRTFSALYVTGSTTETATAPSPPT